MIEIVLQRKAATITPGCKEGSSRQPGPKCPKNGVRARFFSKQRGSIPESGRRRRESERKEPLFPNIWVFLRGKVGRLSVFGRLHKNCFWKTNAQKRPFFSFNRRFWDCFFSARQSSRVTCSYPSFNQCCAIITVRYFSTKVRCDTR